MIFGNEIIVGVKLSFLSPECAKNGWFFDIYIQGSKKVQL